MAFVLGVIFVGCALGDDTTTSPTTDMGAGGSGGGGVDMSAPGCAVVTIAALDAGGNPTKNAPALLTASVKVFGARGQHWTLTHAGGSPQLTPMTTTTDGLSVQQQVSEPGTWTFDVVFDTGQCGTGSITLDNPLGATVTYRFRALPPESSGYPLTEVNFAITGGKSGVQNNITLQTGTPVSGTLRLSGTAVPGEVRLIADDGPDAVALAGSDGAFQLAVQAVGGYTPLLIPDPKASVRAPHLGTHGTGGSFVGAAFDIPGGVAVGGSVVDGAAAPIDKAHVVMRAGVLPSGTGTSDTSGAFTLYAEANTYTLTFDGPDWPEASVPNVVVPGGGTSLAIAYTTSRVAVGGTVVQSNGTPAPYARVTITSRPLGTVATVSVGGGAAMAAAGRVARVVLTDANGALPAMQLPPGTYDLIVEPDPMALSMDGLTAITEVVAGPATWTLTLEKPVPLAVHVVGTDGKGVDQVQLTAIETVGLGAAPIAFTDAAGDYTFTIDKGAPLQLLVEPPPQTNLAGARVPVAANAGSVTVALGPGLLVTGVVQSPQNDPQTGVRVEVLCLTCGSTTPLATSITDSHGIYHIYLPDPGNKIVDGGATD